MLASNNKLQPHKLVQTLYILSSLDNMLAWLHGGSVVSKNDLNISGGHLEIKKTIYIIQVKLCSVIVASHSALPPCCPEKMYLFFKIKAAMCFCFRIIPPPQKKEKHLIVNQSVCLTLQVSTIFSHSWCVKALSVYL